MSKLYADMSFSFLFPRFVGKVSSSHSVSFRFFRRAEEQKSFVLHEECRGSVVECGRTESNPLEWNCGMKVATVVVA